MTSKQYVTETNVADIN